MYGLMSVLECLPACFFAIASICSRTDFSTSEVSTFALSVEMLPATTVANVDTSEEDWPALGVYFFLSRRLVYLPLFSRLSENCPSSFLPFTTHFSCWGDGLSDARVNFVSTVQFQRDNMPLLALGHKMALSLLTLMLGSALATKPRATKRDATAMIRSLGFGLDRNAEPQPVDSEAVKLIKRGPEYDRLN